MMNYAAVIIQFLRFVNSVGACCVNFLTFLAQPTFLFELFDSEK